MMQTAALARTGSNTLRPACAATLAPGIRWRIELLVADLIASRLVSVTRAEPPDVGSEVGHTRENNGVGVNFGCRQSKIGSRALYLFSAADLGLKESKID